MSIISLMNGDDALFCILIILSVTIEQFYTSQAYLGLTLYVFQVL